MPGDRRIEWANTLPEVERLVAGPTTAPSGPASTGTVNDTLDRARTLFREMQQAYASGNFAHYSAHPDNTTSTWLTDPTRPRGYLSLPRPLG